METLRKNLEAIDTNVRLAPAVRLAAAILKEKGEISLDEIAAIPFVDGSDDVTEVLRRLADIFAIEIRQKKVQSSPLLRWEQVVRIKE